MCYIRRYLILNQTLLYLIKDWYFRNPVLSGSTWSTCCTLKFLLHFEVLAALYCLLQVLTGPAKGGAPLGSLVSISALQLCTAEIISRVGEKHCKTFLQHSSPLSEEFVSPRCEQCERLSVVEHKTNKPFLQIDKAAHNVVRFLEAWKCVNDWKGMYSLTDTGKLDLIIWLVSWLEKKDTVRHQLRQNLGHRGVREMMADNFLLRDHWKYLSFDCL